MYSPAEPNATEAQPPAQDLKPEPTESSDTPPDADVWPPFAPTVRRGNETNRRSGASAQVTTTVLHRQTARKAWRG